MNATTRACAAILLAGGLACGASNDSLPKFTVHGKVTMGLKTPAPVAGAYVELVEPAGSGWARVVNPYDSHVPNIVTTKADGSYSYDIIYNSTWFQKPDRPYYVMVSDYMQSYTMVAEIPQDLMAQSANLALDVNPATTVAGLWHCPNGNFSTAQFACPTGSSCSYPGGAPCYLDPNDSRDTGSLVGAMDAAAGTMTEPVGTSWSAWSSALLASAGVQAALSGVMSANVSWTVSPTVLTSEVGNVHLPLIPQPTWVDLNDGSCGAAGHYCSSGQTCSNGVCTSTSSGGGGVWCANWSCGTSQQCAAVMGGSSGSQCSFSDSNSCNQWCKTYIPGGCSCALK